AGFFALARGLLAPRSTEEVRGDRVLREVADLAAVRITEHPFGPQVIEILESLGSPRELGGRLDHAADVALAPGRAAFARAAWSWLSAREKNPYMQPYLQARIVVATLAIGDARGFAQGYTALAEHALEKQSPRRRRPLEWDRQLLFATRDALPLAL